MNESQQLSDLIGDIYDAALDRSLWPSVLENTCSFVTGQAAALVAQNSTQSQFFFEWGHEPRFLESYQQTYLSINPLHVPTIASAKVGEVLLVSECIPFDEFRASRFYREWAGPQGFGDGMFALFKKSATSHAGLTVIRNERLGLVDNTTKQRFGLLAQHFRRAVMIGEIVDLQKFEAAALADSLDGLSAAMFLVDAGGRIVHANASAHAMMGKGDVIRPVAGRFVAVDSTANHALHDIFANANNGDLAISAKGIDVPILARDSENYVAHVLPLTRGARRKASIAYSAIAAVFVRKAQFELPHPLDTIASVFKLTPAELRVLMMAVQLGSVREVAPVLGISEPTVRTHIQHIFEKTGTSRQTDFADSTRQCIEIYE